LTSQYQVDSHTLTDAKRAGQRVMRRYAVALGSPLAAFELLLVVLLVVQYHRLDQQSVQSLNEEVKSQASILSARMAVAAQQLTRSRDAMENCMAHCEDLSKNFQSKFERVTDAEKSQKPLVT
jgi:hypothetical protein